MKYLDTNVILYAIVRDAKYGDACARILSEVERSNLKVGASVLVLLDVMGALRKLNGTLQRKKQPILDLRANLEAILSLPIAWFDMSIFTVERAFEFSYSMKTADFVHLATAESNGMREILSADKEFDEPESIRRIDPLEYEKDSRQKTV